MSRLQNPEQLEQPQQLQLQQGNNLANDLVVSFLENVGGLKKRTSSSFFDVEVNENLEKSWHLLGSSHGSLLEELPVGVIALYKQKDGVAMARTLNAVAGDLVTVSLAVLATLRNSLSTNCLYSQQSKGLSILMCKAKAQR